MLCSKCYQKIPREEEIQIEGSIICQKCVLNSPEKREVIGRCNRCSNLIYKDEIVHEVYENWGAENSEKLIKCQLCYENWLKIANLKRKSWKITKWFDNVFLPFNMWFVLAFMTINKNKENVGWGPILLILILCASVVLLSPLFLDFILFVYRKIIESKYVRKLKKQEQKIVELTKKFQEKVILRVELYWKVNQIKSGKINDRTL